MSPWRFDPELSDGQIKVSWRALDLNLKTASGFGATVENSRRKIEKFSYLACETQMINCALIFNSALLKVPT